jgi:DNA-binding MarR family transcriptional regulator
VELAQRLEKAGLISREHSADDARVMLLGLTEEGEDRLERLTLSHRAELKLLGPKIIKLLSSLDPS